MHSLFLRGWGLPATAFLMIVSNNEKCITSIAWSSGCCFSVIVKYYCLAIFLLSFSVAWCFCRSKDGLIYGLACRMRKTWFIHCWRKIALHVETLFKWVSEMCLLCGTVGSWMCIKYWQSKRELELVGWEVMWLQVCLWIYFIDHIRKGSKTCKLAEAKKEKKNK